MTCQNKRHARYFFSLLEILVCLTIITSISSIFVVHGKSLLQQHRFHMSSHAFLRDLQKWKLLSLVYRCDVYCTIAQQDGVYVVTWTLEFPVDGIPLTSHLKLSNVEKLYWNAKEISCLETTLLSSGRPTIQGTLTFTKDQEQLSCSWSCPERLYAGIFPDHLCELPPYPERQKERFFTQDTLSSPG